MACCSHPNAMTLVEPLHFESLLLIKCYLQEETAKRLLARPHYDMEDVPEWAYYEVLGFKVDKETAIKTAILYFKEQGHDQEYLQKLEAEMLQSRWLNTTTIFRGLNGYLEPKRI